MQFLLNPLIRFSLVLMTLLLSTPIVIAQHEVEGLTPVRLQLIWKHQFEFAGFYAAKARGYYEQAGLDVEITPFSAGNPAPIDTLMNGDAEFAVGDSSIFLERAKGKPVKLLANIFQHNPLLLLTLADSGILSPAQMKGKKIMLAAHEADNAAILALLAAESVTLDDMQVVDHSFALDPIIDGDVDIISAFATNEPGLLRKRGIQFNLIDPLNFGIDFYGNNIYTHEKFLQTHADQAQAFVEASLRGWEYALKNKAEIIDLILRDYSQEKSREDLIYEAQAIENYILPDHIALGDINLERLQRIVQTYQNLGQIDKDFNYREILPATTPEVKTTLSLTAAEKLWIQQHQNLKLGIDPSWPPFEFINENGQYSGMAAEIMKLISEKTGLSFQVQHHDTWQEVIKSAKEKKLNILPAVTPSTERENFLDFTTSHLSYPMVILTNKDGQFFTRISELNGKTVIVIEDYVTEDLLRRNHPNINLILATDMNQALDRLSSGDADAFIDNLASITYSISQRGFSNLRISGTTPYRFDLSFGITKGQPELLGILNKALGSISVEEINNIRSRWISAYSNQPLDLKKLAGGGLVIAAFILMMLFWNRKLASEIKRRKAYSDEIVAKEKRFRDLFVNNKAIELIINPASNEIVDVNNAAISFYGYSKSDFLNLSITDINTLNANDIKYEMELAAKEDRSYFIFKHKMSDGTIKDVEVYSGPIVWGERKLLYMIVHDITARIRAEKELVTAKAEAEKAARIKSEFLANMSHEIRTPMNSVLGMAELLQETPINYEQKEMLSILKSSGNSLISLINNILDFSKLEARKMVIDHVEFELIPFIRETVNTFESFSQNKNIKLITETDKKCDVLIYSDPVRIRQILLNLIGNAVKFTEKGSVTVQAKLEQNSQNRAQLVIHVIDTGIGLKESERINLFESFAQAEQSTTRKFGGTGLGLAISLKIIELLEGSIDVKSAPGQGSTFSINIPVEYKKLTQQEHHQRRLLQQQKATQRPIFKANILIAEDVIPNRILIDKMLLKFGLTSQFAENGQQAVIMAQSFPYDLILMDCQMPVMDGYMATRKIREFNQQTPILALTANASFDDQKLALESGMNEVLTKPIQLSVLEKALKKWLGNSTTEPQLLANKIISKKGIPLTMVNYETLKKLQQDMEESFDEVYQSIFSSLNKSLDELKTLPTENETITRLFHSIKSPAATLGAEQLAELAADYEAQSRQQGIQNLPELLTNIETHIQAVQQELSEFYKSPA